MRLILIGCEYAGKTTLADHISDWMRQKMGVSRVRWHDHFILPIGADEAEKVASLALMPALKEKLQRYQIWRHLHPTVYRNDDYLAVNLHYADAVYAPLYYGYGGPDDPFGDRRRRARAWDAEVMLQAPDTVLVLVKASVEAIRERLAKSPRPMCILREEEVALVLSRFEEEYANSLILRRFSLDTTDLSPGRIFEEFLKRMQPYFSRVDHLRILTQQTLQQRASEAD